MTITASGVTTEELIAARRSADSMRGEWLDAVRGGLVTLPELIEQSTLPGFEPLRKITLEQALRARTKAPHDDSDLTSGSARSWKWIVSRMYYTLENNESNTRTTLAWLTAAESGRKRIHALAEAVLAASPSRHHRPWPGYPLAPDPRA